MTVTTPSLNSLNFISPPSLATAGLTFVSNIFTIFFSISDRSLFIEFLLSLSIIISFINDYYSNGNEIVINKENKSSSDLNLTDIEKKIINILETKVRPAVARDGGDIKFKEFKDGIVTVNLQGSCSGCPSSTMTLKQGVQNLLCHYIPEIKEVIAI